MLHPSLRQRRPSWCRLRHADCDGDLICDEHDGASTCQEPHGHDDDKHDDLDEHEDHGGVGHAHGEADVVDGGLHHDHTPVDVSALSPLPTAELEAFQDGPDGWNLHFDYEHFELTPENASGEQVPGEGHLHLHINGARYSRILSAVPPAESRVYSSWFHLGELPSGENELKVELVSNDHGAYTLEGEPISSSATLAVD